jgi:hypothetical protein
VRLLLPSLLLLSLLPGLAWAGSPIAALRDRADEAVRARLEGRLLTEDDRLAEVARWVAAETLDAPPELAAVRHKMWVEGVRDFEFLPISIAVDVADPVEALEGLLQDNAVAWERFNVLAVGAARRGRLRSVSVLLTRRAATFVPAMEQDAVLVRLSGAHDAPTLFATMPDGTVDRRPGVAVGDRWRLDTGMTVAGGWLFELLAEGPRGPEVLAMWPDHLAGDAPRRAPSEVTILGAPAGPGSPPDPTEPFPDEGPVAWSPYSDFEAPGGGAPRDSAAWVTGGGPGPDRSPTADDARAAEDHLWSLLNATRTSRGLVPLRRDPGVTRAARKQARELSRGDFGHETISGTALDRIGAEGLTASRVTENIARAADVAQAHAALMASPAHRANLLDPSVSAGGVGVVLRRDTSGRWTAVVSEVFATLLGRTDEADWPVALSNRINDQRLAVGLETLTLRETMSGIAEAAALGVIESGVLTLPPERRSALAEELRFHYLNARNVGVDLVVTAAPETVERLGHVMEPTFSEVGIGVVRLEERLGEHAAGSLVVVLLFVER